MIILLGNTFVFVLILSVSQKLFKMNRFGNFTEKDIKAQIELNIPKTLHLPKVQCFSINKLSYRITLELFIKLDKLSLYKLKLVAWTNLTQRLVNMTKPLVLRTRDFYCLQVFSSNYQATSYRCKAIIYPAKWKALVHSILHLTGSIS